MIRSTLSTSVNTTMGRVRRRTSTKQRSIAFVVRSFRHRCTGSTKKCSSSGRSRSSCLTRTGYRHPTPPMEPEALEGPSCRSDILGQVDLLRFGFDLPFISPFHLLQKVPHLVHPAALVPHPRIDRLDRPR